MTHSVIYGIHLPISNTNVFNENWVDFHSIYMDFPVIRTLLKVNSLEDIVIFNKWNSVVPRFDRKGYLKFYLRGKYFATFLNDGKTYILSNNRIRRITKANQLFEHIDSKSLPFIYEK
jgi:hypothetical protein